MAHSLSEDERTVRALVADHNLMPPREPPWKLVSPTGVLFVVTNNDELDALVLAELGAADFHVNIFNMHCLLGIRLGNTGNPKHVQFWQPLTRLQFIKHKDEDQPLPVVGGLGRHGLEHFVTLNERQVFLNGKREVARSLRDLLSGSYKSNKRFSNDWKGWSLVAPPDNLEQWLPRGQVRCGALPACGM